jgi:hypothetical protein
MKPSWLISVATWQTMSLKEKSKLIDELWQIKDSAESLGAAWNVVKLLTDWGCSIEWIDDGKGIYCLVDIEKSKIGLANDGVGYGQTLAEALCCASLRCVGLLDLR